MAILLKIAIILRKTNAYAYDEDRPIILIENQIGYNTIWKDQAKVNY